MAEWIRCVNAGCEETFATEEEQKIHQHGLCEHGLILEELSPSLELRLKYPKICKMKDFGCEFMCEVGDALEQHQLDVANHFTLVCDLVRRLHAENEELGEKVRTLSRNSRNVAKHSVKRSRIRHLALLSLCYIPLVLIFSCILYLFHAQTDEGRRELRYSILKLKEDNSKLKEIIALIEDMRNLTDLSENLTEMNSIKDEKITALSLALERTRSGMEQSNHSLEEWLRKHKSRNSELDHRMDRLETRLNIRSREERLNVTVGTEVFPKDKTVEDIIRILSVQIFKSSQVGRNKFTDIHPEMDLDKVSSGQVVDVEFVDGEVYECWTGHRSDAEERRVGFGIVKPSNRRLDHWPPVDRVLWGLVNPSDGRVLYYQVLSGEIRDEGTYDEYLAFGRFHINNARMDELRTKVGKSIFKTTFIVYKNPT